MSHKKSGMIIRILMIIFVIGLAITSGVISLAEFTKSDRAMRVVATYGNNDPLFSSNYLINVESVQNRRTIYVSAESVDPVADVFICNHAQGNPVKTYESDINYRVTAKFVIYNNAAGTITDATAAEVGAVTAALGFKDESDIILGSSKLSHSFTSTLSRLSSSEDPLKITFDSEIFNNSNDLRLEVVAEPIGTFYDIYTLRCLFNCVVRGIDEQLTWEGYFNEGGARGNGTPVPSAYDGFNYVIAGSGSGSVTLRWKSDAVTISDEFITSDMGGMSIINEANNWKSITFSVDSDLINRYDLQFYKADGTSDSEFASWDTVKSYVEFSFS